MLSERQRRLIENERLKSPDRAMTIPAMRRGTITAGNGIIWATVIRRPQYASPEGVPEEGYADYVLRLESSNYSEWTAGVYLENSLVLKDGRLYRSNTETSVTWEEGEWDLQDEINPQHLDFGAVDWRDFAPWCTEGKSVPLIQRGGIYFFWQQMTRVRVSGDLQSVAWNAASDRMMAVYG